MFLAKVHKECGGWLWSSRVSKEGYICRRCLSRPELKVDPIVDKFDEDAIELITPKELRKRSI